MYQIYTKDNCPDCKKAKVLLRFHEVEYEELDGIKHIADLQAYGHKSFPMVMKKGQYLGGWKQLQEEILG